MPRDCSSTQYVNVVLLSFHEASVCFSSASRILPEKGFSNFTFSMG